MKETGKHVAARMPRGIRNHNPGNIRHARTRWQGLADVQADKEFVSFVSPEMGVRALMRVLLTYQQKYGLKTIRDIMARYAPPQENDTRAYAAAVAKSTGCKETTPIDLLDTKTLIAVAKAIVRHENGTPPADRPGAWYAQSVYEKAVSLL